MIGSSRNGESLRDAFERLQVEIEEAVFSVGGVLLRGFDVPSVEEFQQSTVVFGHPVLSYDLGSTPRTAVGSGVYMSTEYPAPLHNDQAYTWEWAMKLWFYCVTAADNGSPIPDTVFDEIRSILAEQTAIFPWQVEDVLMLDNMLVAHERTPFKGERKMVAAMAEPHGNLDGFPGESK